MHQAILAPFVTEVNAEPICECHDCHQNMVVDRQPRLTGEGFHTLVTCRNSACDLRNVTLPVGEYAAKTTADPGAADPGLVPLSVEQLQPARGSVQEHQPAVLEILGPDVDDGIAALFGPGGIADDHTPDCRLF